MAVALCVVGREGAALMAAGSSATHKWPQMAANGRKGGTDRRSKPQSHYSSTLHTDLQPLRPQP